MQRVKPTTGLTDVFNNEVTWIVLIKPFLIFERIMHLSKRHRATLKPAVENFGNSTHHRLSRWIIWVRPHQIVYNWSMQFGNYNAKISLQVGKTSVHINARICRIITAPNRYRRTPKAIATNRPVACIFEPFAKASVLQVIRHPSDLFVESNHALFHRCHVDEP